MSRFWFALVEIEPMEGNSAFAETDIGAYVITVGSAETKDDFIALLKSRLEEDFMRLVDIDDLQPLDPRPRWDEDESEQLRYLVSFISEDQPVVLGDVYLFEEAD